MALVLLVLLLALLFGGFGFAVHALWWIAIILLIFWCVGWFTGSGRWYHRHW